MKFCGPSSIIPLACGVAISLCGAARAASGEKPVAEDYSHWVKVPGGLYHPDCVHEVPNGAHIEMNGDVTVAGSVVAHFDACTHTPILTGRPLQEQGTPASGTPCNFYGCGWIEDARMWPTLPAGENISEVESYWTVPPPPSQSGAAVFLWNGIGTQSFSWIMQPVLTYGSDTVTAPNSKVSTSGEVYGSGGGNYWSIASWLVSGPTIYHSQVYRVSPGDKIWGISFQTGQSNEIVVLGTRVLTQIVTDYAVAIVDENTGDLSLLGFSMANVQWNAGYAGVLEGGGLTNCAQLPPGPGTYFYDAQIYTGYPTQTYLTPNWLAYKDNFPGGPYGLPQGVQGGPQCSYNVSIDNENPAASLFYN
jgi:hypothetical protein